MKKFVYILNILLLVLVPTTIFVGGKENTINYHADTTTSIKMIKTTVLLDRSTKKKEEEAAIAQKLAQEEAKKQEELKKQRELEEAKKREEAKKVVEPVKVKEDIGSLAGSNDSSVGSNVDVVANADKRVFVGAKFYDRRMSAYGTDCCSSNPDKWGLTASGFKLQYKNTNFYAGSDYGNIRIVAADHKGQLDFPLCTIVKIDDPIDGVYNAIVLDRGDSNIGLDRSYIFDLVVETQDFARIHGIRKNITVEVLRLGTYADLQKVRREGHL